MRTVVRLIVVLALALSIVACVRSPVAPPPGAPATGLPAIPSPGASFEPGQPKPSIEVPPPIY